MGGNRAGTPGVAYQQRTDLNRERSLPVRTAPGQTYGAAQAQAEAQRAVPMAPQPSPVPGAAPPPGPGATPPPLPSGAPAQAPIAPGAFGPIDRPTERPHEPVTAGIASGAGPGPEVLPTAAQMTGNTLSSTLAQLAQQSNSPAIRALAMHAQAAGS